jgi:hypothetical protein
MLLQIDTQAASPGEALRTKRTTKLELDLRDSPAKPGPGRDDVSDACRAMGVKIEGWQEAEVEAVRRLWTLRAEWARCM